ncbi:MAG: DUF3052 domain-containing protein [Verrucomicrobia bacterium]|nr:DUF3052 domain-containing protein [Verrucomicrobiota bacterium]
MPGYSGTPLVQKLGLKEDFRIRLVNAPDDLPAGLGPVPADIVRARDGRAPVDVVLFFAPSRVALEEPFGKLAAPLKPAGMLWIGWPKKSSGVVTDITESLVRETGLMAGLVDVKVCAITNVWSGLQCVRRVKDR